MTGARSVKPCAQPTSSRWPMPIGAASLRRRRVR